MKKQTETSCPYICIYESYMDVLSPFSDAERGRLLTAMLTYMYHGTEPEFEGNERFIWPSLKGQIDRDKAAYAARCEANRENGKKGGRPKTQKTQKTEGLISKPKKAKEKEKEKEKKKEKENEKENENEREISSGALSSAPPVPPEVSFHPPEVWEVDKYCREQGYEVDPWRFLDYYGALGWRLGNTPIRDWKALIRRWDDPREHIPGRMGQEYEEVWRNPCKSG